MTIDLNTTQQRFVDEAAGLAYRPGLYTLCGYAGTGKTTALKFLHHKVPEIIFLAPTHKAKNVLMSKLDTEAVMTVTSFIKAFQGTKLERLELALAINKDPKEGPKIQKRIDALKRSGNAQQPVFGERSRPPELEGRHVIVVVDEASMVTRTDRDKVMKNCDTAFFVGDGFQLPPVTRDSSEDWFATYRHNWQFDEVVRQAEDSGILVLANEIRRSRGEFDIRAWVFENRKRYDDIFSITQSGPMLEAIEGPDAVALSFTNAVVDEICYDVRRHFDRDPERIGHDDKLFSANNYDGFQNKDEIQVMGTHSVTDPVATFTNITQGYNKVVMVNNARIDSDLGSSQRKEALSERGLLPRFDYARTVHSSQGSEWQTVVYEHSNVNYIESPRERNRLVYTAVTRAQERFALLI